MQGLIQSPILRQELVQAQMHFETAGELELLSLHKIKNRIDGLDIHSEVRQKLITSLIKENNEYKTDSGNNWNCITPNSLYYSVDNTINYLTEQLNIGISAIDDAKIKQATRKVVYNEINVQNTKIKQWFHTNYDNIIYDTRGNIPYPIVRQMREELGKWVLGNTNPFSEPIGDLIEKTARSVGIDPNHYENYEGIWKALKR
tara:strand:+ start:105 stop:710 length:606 start_codon:yes stop_codon:yes gene_type:complete